MLCPDDGFFLVGVHLEGDPQAVHLLIAQQSCRTLHWDKARPASGVEKKL